MLFCLGLLKMVVIVRCSSKRGPTVLLYRGQALALPMGLNRSKML